MGRSFAHLGVPPLYIGEAGLALFLVARGRWLLGLWLKALVIPSPLSGLVWALFVSGLYGLLQFLRGVDHGYDRMAALQNLAFHAYPLFLFLGLWVGRRHPNSMPRLIRLLAWVHGLYGVAFIIVLHKLGPDNPDLGEVSWFGDPVGSGVILLGLVAFERRLVRVWVPLLLNACVLLTLQVRAEMLGLAVALLLWGCLSGRFLQLCGLAVVATTVLLAAYIADLRIPSTATRGGEISARAIVGKALAPLDPEEAKLYKRDADIDAETIAWRTDWWRAIWGMVHSTPERTLFGPGYGYALWELHPLEIGDENLRSPHNVFMYALAYTGWTGVILFYALQLALAVLLWQAYRLTGQPFGLCVWSLLLVKGTFENFFETPFNAIPFYLLVGLALAPLFTGGIARANVVPPPPTVAPTEGS